MCKTSASEEASAYWWSSRYKEDKVIATIGGCEEEFIAEAV